MVSYRNLLLSNIIYASISLNLVGKCSQSYELECDNVCIIRFSVLQVKNEIVLFFSLLMRNVRNVKLCFDSVFSQSAGSTAIRTVLQTILRMHGSFAAYES